MDCLRAFGHCLMTARRPWRAACTRYTARLAVLGDFSPLSAMDHHPDADGEDVLAAVIATAAAEIVYACDDGGGVLVQRTGAQLLADLPPSLRLGGGVPEGGVNDLVREVLLPHRGTAVQLRVRRVPAAVGTSFCGYVELGEQVVAADAFDRFEAHNAPHGGAFTGAPWGFDTQHMGDAVAVYGDEPALALLTKADMKGARAVARYVQLLTHAPQGYTHKTWRYVAWEAGRIADVLVQAAAAEASGVPQRDECVAEGVGGHIAALPANTLHH